MLRRGAVLGLALFGLVQGGPGGPVVDQCVRQCQQVYSLNQANFEQVRPSLDACQAGCQFFGRIEARNGFQDTLGNLQSCNQSCDERFEGALLPACQSGCGFHFDSDVSAQRSSQLARQGPSPPAPIFTRGPPPPPPTFPRARGPTFIRTQGPPRPTVFRPEESSQTWQETPRTSIQPQTPAAPRMSSQAPRAPAPRANIPSFLNIFRAPGPVMLRPQSFNATPQRVSPVMATPPPQANMVTKENPRGPTIIGFSLPQLLSRVQNIIPRMEQAMPRMQKMPTMEEIFSKMEEPEVDEDVEIFDEGHPRFEGRPSFEFNLPSMGRVFEEIGEALPKMEQRIEPLMNRVMEIEIENPFEDFKETPRMSMPRFPGNFLGHWDRDEDFDFGGLFDHLTNQVMSSQFSRSWSPFGQPEVGKLTVIKAGPGFHDEKHYDIGPNGKLTEISETPIHKDALEHENPMDVHFNSNDVEVFHTDDKPTESAVKATGEGEKQEEEVASEPVMKAGESVEFQPKNLPFLAVLRNTVEENERMSQQLLQRYRTLAEQEYRDDYTCNSDHLKWSDWVACLHARVGVPRWLTAATISLGIVFSFWLCLVIPSAAPKQRIRALVIKTEKPSAALAKAKEAEAASKACEAAGVDPKTVVSVVRVDLPPSYGDVRPASPAPSYKSDMAVPASPAPSYRSVAPATKEEEADEKVVLEPVHGEEEKKKESAA